MAVVINTNYAATLASNNLSTSNQALQKSLNRLSSGSKIVNPSDDAGGLAVSMKLSSAARRQGAVSNNIANALSFLQTQDGALGVTGRILDRISELKTLYGDATKNASDKANYNTEFAALRAQLSSIGNETFNGINLFASSAMAVGTTEDSSTSSSVSVQGVDLLGTTASSAFPSIVDSFANLSNWTNLGSNNATVAGGELFLPGTNINLKTNQSLSGPFDINFDYRAEFANNGSFIAKLGASTMFMVPNAPDLTSHHVRITSDGAGNISWYLNNAATPTGTTTIAATSGQLSFTQFGGGQGSFLSNFSAVSTVLGASNTSSVASAGGLGSLNLSTITSAIQDVATYRAQNGASQSRLNFASELNIVNKANLESANSRITDVDVASESTQLARYNILVQSGTAMLGQANQSPQLALKLLG